MEQSIIHVFAMRVEEDKVFRGRLERKENTLAASRSFVGGYIQVVSLSRDIDLIVNDEGKLEELPYNRVWCDEYGKVGDILAGNVFACRHDDEGNFISILETDIPFILQRLPAFSRIGENTIHVWREEDLPEYEES